MLVERMFVPAVLAAVALAATPAAAAPTKSSKAACVAAHEEGQTLRTDNQPHAARERFVACARAECPVVLRKECSAQLAAIDEIAPSVALEARDEQGMSDPEVKVWIDGRLVAERLTGESVDVEPGEHAIRFERRDGKVSEQKILVALGEKNRKVVAEFAPPETNRDAGAAAPPVAPPERKVPVLSYVAGGVALAAAGSFAFFAVSGKNSEDDLSTRCAPTCTSDDVAPVHRDYLAADVSLGVAVVAAAVAVVLALPALGAPARASTSAMPWMPAVRTRSARR